MVTSDELQDLETVALKLRFHDVFLGSDSLGATESQTGAVTYDLAKLLCSSGVQQGSVARAYYTQQVFNPRYGMLRVKLRVSDMASAFAFVGFKYSNLAPTWRMTESHAGLVLYHGAAYFSAGNGSTVTPSCSVVPIAEADLTRWLTFEITATSLRFYSLPYTVPYFSQNVLPGIVEGKLRKWSPWYRSGTVIPDDVVHYLIAHVENLTGSNKDLQLEFVDYSEVYPD